MSLTPDYFISSCGYPVLNREKFKLDSKLHISPSSSSSLSMQQSLLTTDKKSERNMKNVLRLNCCDIATDNRNILLAKRKMRRVVTSNVEEPTMETTTPIARQQQQYNNGINDSLQHKYNCNDHSGIPDYNWNWANDKEMKCFVNERIKECSQHRIHQQQQQQQQRQQSQYHSNLR